LIKHLQRLFTKYSESEKKLAKAIKNIGGFRPYNIKLYALAMRHTSAAKTDKMGFKSSNERLEYLGDAVLGTVVAEYLFKKFPYRDEGFLTEIRSRLVSRDALNMLAMKLGLNRLVEFEGKRKTGRSYKSMYGDAMEAFIGAIYLDRGFHFCRNYIIQKLIMQHYDLKEITETISNYKSAMIEWAQKNGKAVRFDLIENDDKQFRIKIIVENKVLAEGFGFNKKKAEQDAARKAYENLITSDDDDEEEENS